MLMDSIADVVAIKKTRASEASNPCKSTVVDQDVPPHGMGLQSGNLPEVPPAVRPDVLQQAWHICSVGRSFVHFKEIYRCAEMVLD